LLNLREAVQREPVFLTQTSWCTIRKPNWSGLIMPMKLPAVHWRDFQRPDCEVTASVVFFLFFSTAYVRGARSVF